MTNFTRRDFLAGSVCGLGALAASPLLGLTLTLLAYQAAVLVNKRCGGHRIFPAPPGKERIKKQLDELWDYADNVNSIEFLINLVKKNGHDI